MKSHRIHAVVALLAAMVCAACDLQAPPPDRRQIPGAISLPSTWRLTSDGGGIQNLQYAIDGNTMTAATTAGSYRGASVTIDLGRTCLFNMITILHGQQHDGFAKTVSVYTSHDGRRYTKQYTTYGTRAATYLPILTPIRARYVRLVAEEQGLRPWAIAEIYLQ